MPYRRPKIEVATTNKMRDITPFTSLLPVMGFWNRFYLDEVIDTSIGIRKQKGYQDSEQLLAIVLLNLSRGRAFEHLKFLKEQAGWINFP